MNNNLANNYQANMVNLLNNYLSDMAVLTVNLFNYHWNIVGSPFYALHEKFQEYYEETIEMYDEVAERIKQLGGFPITCLRDYCDNAKLKTAPSKDYTLKESVTNLTRDFQYMAAFGNQIVNYASEAKDEATVVLIGDMVMFFEKGGWMLRATLK